MAAHLGMFRKTRHWGFSSWILEVRSVPSHWRQHRGIQTAVNGMLAFPSPSAPYSDCSPSHLGS